MIIELRNEIFDPEIIPDDYLSVRMRNARNRLLSESDWAMASDAPTDKTAWGNYRQALRNFPATWTPAETAEFPDSPEAN
jgi:hypothetical protein